jgi:hypothetical protein
MGDGSTKAIEDVEVGDLVLATDPQTGVAGGRMVIALIVGQGDKDLVEVTVDTDGGNGGDTGTVTATDGHPFWVENQGAWVDAKDLRPGHMLRTSAGTWVQVTAVREFQRHQRVHNLTITDLHTYHVTVGDTQALVHNCGDGLPCAGNCKIVGDGTPRVYERPMGTTRAQRASVQCKPCVTCGVTDDVMVADHKVPLVVEWYQNFKINLTRAKSVDAVQPQCRSCSDRQGGRMRAFGQRAARAFGLIE